jgi:tetratricopeptide (TPR) repeat protein
MNLTWQYRLINQLDSSEYFGRLGVERAKKDADRHAIVEICTNLGETLMARDKLDEAKSFYETGLEWSTKEDDRDKYVFDVYHARFLWNSGNKESAIENLKQAIEFLINDEVFYEMLARAYLADYAFNAGKIQLAEDQIRFFKNPRANYFSQEARIIAGMVEVNILAVNDRIKAEGLLKQLFEQVDLSGAEYLKGQLNDLKDELIL